MVNNIAPILSLPSELLEHILRFVSDKNGKGNFSFVCRAFYTIAHHFKNFVEEGYQPKLTALVEALSERALTTEERCCIIQNVVQTGTQITLPLLANPKAQEKGLRKVATTLDEYYEAFKKRCNRLNIDLYSNEFINETHSAFHSLQIQSASAKNQDGIEYKIDTTSFDISQKIFKDTIEDFVNRPAESITMEGFVKTAQRIRGLFTDNTMPEVEAQLRTFLLEKHEQAFLGLASEFLDSINPRIRAEGAFYRELCIPVSAIDTQSAEARYNAIHEIIGHS